MPFVLLLPAKRCPLWLTGEGHDGGGGVRGGGDVLAVGEAVQVLAGGIDGAVDGTLRGTPHAVLLRLIQIVGDPSFCMRAEFVLSKGWLLPFKR